MALYSYSKAPVKFRKPSATAEKKEMVFEKIERRKGTLGDLLTGIGNDFQELLTTSRVASLFIPLILILVGGYILYNQVTPTVQQKLKEASGYYEQGNVALIDGEYVSAKDRYLSNPGADYFETLTNEALQQHVLLDDPTSNNYRGRFYLTIDALGLKRLPVTANVESGIEDVYKSILNSSLAHFKGTGLPISEVDNNMVIYGHSASGDFYERTGDNAAAFSKLSDLKIGDEVKIEMDGKTYNYKIYKSKIVEPDDISIINGTPNKRTLTLFTCYPRGSSGKRYVAIARPVEE
jgi:LPXTG-site transpeptidase (sortase) family protein